MAIKLVTPDKKYALSFVEALREGLELYTEDEEKIARIEADFDGWLKDSFDLSRPVKQADGSFAPRVPHSVYWLVREDRFIGRVSVRHHIHTEILQSIGGHIGYAVRASERRKGYGRMLLDLVKPHAKAIGLSKALITCRDDNFGSIRIIESAGAVLENKIPRPDGNGIQRRYWLDI